MDEHQKTLLPAVCFSYKMSRAQLPFPIPVWVIVSIVGAYKTIFLSNIFAIRSTSQMYSSNTLVSRSQTLFFLLSLGREKKGSGERSIAFLF